MTPERWREVTDKFHTALALATAERSRFLDEACQEDLDLRAEVCAMLAAHDRAAGTPDVPVVSISTDSVRV